MRVIWILIISKIKKIILNILGQHEVTFVKNYNLSDIEEFSLYSKYKYAIIANSTFSLMSSYLSLTRELSIAPKIWLRGERLDKKNNWKIYNLYKTYFVFRFFYIK